MFNSSATDASSPVYPDRLIRPLPKRTLRSRLSSDMADSISYPVAPSISRIFGDTSTDSKREDEDQNSAGSDLRHPYERGLEHGLGSGDEDGRDPAVVRRSDQLRQPSSGCRPQNYMTGIRTEVKSSSQGDGYDAFENTNNKKKRKIPSPAVLSSHSTLSREFANLGLSVPASSSVDTGTYYGTGNAASPVAAGALRGRSGRTVSRGDAGKGSLESRRDPAESTGTHISWFGIRQNVVTHSHCSSVGFEVRSRYYLRRHSKCECQ